MYDGWFSSNLTDTVDTDVLVSHTEHVGMRRAVRIIELGLGHHPRSFLVNERD